MNTMNTQHGSVCWNELMTRDVPGALAYYAKVCGWTFERRPVASPDRRGDGDYHLAMLDGRPAAGIMDMAMLPDLAEVPPHWFTYLAVDAIDTALSETVASGGTVMRPPFDVPDLGRMAIVQDPTGAVMGFIEMLAAPTA